MFGLFYFILKNDIILYMNKEKYVWLPYDPIYIKLFQEEKEKLEKFLGKTVNIQHCGSTSVPGLGGKGILDIVLGAESNNLKEVSKLLQENEYEYKPQGGNKDRLFYEYIYEGNNPRRVHLHLVVLNGEEWISKLAFRDYLLKNQRKASAYSEIKKEAVRQAKGDKEIYQKIKNVFIDDISKKSIKEYNKIYEKEK